MNSINKNIILMVLIVIIAISLRFTNLNLFPPALNWDEVSLFYNSWSIFQTGKDEWSTTTPLIFRAFGDYKLPGYIYSLVPIQLINLDINIVRIPSAFSGVLFVIVVWLTVYKLTGKIYSSTLSAYIAAVIPWNIFQSRISLEANLALTFFSLGFALYVYRHGYVSGIFLGLSALTYNSYRVIVPAFLGYLLITRRAGSKSISFVTFICFIPILLQFAAGTGSARYRLVEILDSGAIASIEQLRNQTNLPSELSKLFYNRVTYFTFNSFTNYLLHFSPNYLFVSGGDNYQFNIQNHGLLYISIAPAILYGLYLSIRQKKSTVLILLLITPLAAALTRDAPHALRSSPMILPILIITGFGITKRLVFPTVAITFLLTVNYLSLWPEYSLKYAPAWQYGYPQLIEYLKNVNPQKQIAITKKYGEPHIFLAAMLPINPKNYQSETNLIRYEKSDWFWVDRFNRFTFVNDWELTKFADNNNIADWVFVSSPESRIQSNLVKTIYFPNGDPAFYIYE